MELTPEWKAAIDKLNYEQLLYHWRFASVEDPRFHGETGTYWVKRMRELRDQPGGNDEHVTASKSIGWEKP